MEALKQIQSIINVIDKLLQVYNCAFSTFNLYSQIRLIDLVSMFQTSQLYKTTKFDIVLELISNLIRTNARTYGDWDVDLELLEIKGLKSAIDTLFQF